MTNIKDEISKLNNAIEKVSEHLDGMYEIAAEEFGDKYGDIFAAQKMILNDTGFFTSICSEIENGLNASDAVRKASDKYKSVLSNSEEEIIKAKVSDISDIEKRLVNVIENNVLCEGEESVQREGILDGDSLSTSDILLLDKDKVLEIVFENTTEFSHKVILAKARGFNITLNSEGTFDSIVESSGLKKRSFFRTEYLFMNRDAFPSEEEQTDVYSRYIDNVKSEPGFPIIRIFDISDDKSSDLFKSEESGFVSLRGVRRALMYEDVLKNQIRAIVNAVISKIEENSDISVGILVPMIATVTEADRVKKILEKEVELIAADSGIGFKELISHIKYGLMIETPAAALISDSLAMMCDFFMVGLNDLIQYTYAIDRNSKDLLKVYRENKEAINLLIQRAKESAAASSISIDICGNAF